MIANLVVHAGWTHILCDLSFTFKFQIFVSASNISRFELTGLAPHHDYTFRVSCQMNDTINPNTWSDNSTDITLKTITARKLIKFWHF